MQDNDSLSGENLNHRWVGVAERFRVDQGETLANPPAESSSGDLPAFVVEAEHVGVWPRVHLQTPTPFDAEYSILALTRSVDGLAPTSDHVDSESVVESDFNIRSSVDRFERPNQDSLVEHGEQHFVVFSEGFSELPFPDGLFLWDTYRQLAAATNTEAPEWVSDDGRSETPVQRTPDDFQMNNQQASANADSTGFEIEPLNISDDEQVRDADSLMSGFCTDSNASDIEPSPDEEDATMAVDQWDLKSISEADAEVSTLMDDNADTGCSPEQHDFSNSAPRPSHSAATNHTYNEQARASVTGNVDVVPPANQSKQSKKSCNKKYSRSEMAQLREDAHWICECPCCPDPAPDRGRRQREKSRAKSQSRHAVSSPSQRNGESSRRSPLTNAIQHRIDNFGRHLKSHIVKDNLGKGDRSRGRRQPQNGLRISPEDFKRIYGIAQMLDKKWLDESNHGTQPAVVDHMEPGWFRPMVIRSEAPRSSAVAGPSRSSKRPVARDRQCSLTPEEEIPEELREVLAIDNISMPPGRQPSSRAVEERASLPDLQDQADASMAEEQDSEDEEHYQESEAG